LLLDILDKVRSDEGDITYINDGKQINTLTIDVNSTVRRDKAGQEKNVDGIMVSSDILSAGSLIRAFDMVYRVATVSQSLSGLYEYALSEVEDDN